VLLFDWFECGCGWLLVIVFVVGLFIMFGSVLYVVSKYVVVVFVEWFCVIYVYCGVVV